MNCDEPLNASDQWPQRPLVSLNRTRTRYDLPIYLNRVTGKTSEPASLPRGDRPTALVYFGSRKAPDPQLTDPWRVVAEGPDGKSKWRLYLRPAK